MSFIRAAVVSPELRIADVAFNNRILEAEVRKLAAGGCQLAVFPELCLTGYSAGDLFFQERLVEAAGLALAELADRVRDTELAVVVGLPVAHQNRLYNCATLLQGGEIRGVVPKVFLPTNGEFYEARWFASGRTVVGRKALIGGKEIPFGIDLLFPLESAPHGTVGIEVCEDLWAPIPPSSHQSLAGANILVNLSSSNEILGKAAYRRDLVRQQSARCIAAYLYASSGPGESSTDVVCSGHGIIAENGAILGETERFSFDSVVAMADLDLQRLHHDRVTNSSFRAQETFHSFQRIPLRLPPWEIAPEALKREVAAYPFVPSDPKQREAHCQEVFAIQSTGLAKRLRHIRAERITLGLSGGLDSTLALLIAASAFDKLSLRRESILAVTMPGFGTTDRTQGNAERLAKNLGVTLRTIPIRDSVTLHLKEIGHPPDQHDVTFENAQARERTQVLMDLANQTGGIVLGTGDLSELALGWCTFNGDHMSMYHVNAGVPKTLVKYLVQWCAEEVFSEGVASVLRDICDTPISPELLPPGQGSQVIQMTEAIVGPYALHDFFLFHMVRFGAPPVKIFYLARRAFAGVFTETEILTTLETFYKRFFSQQFKRSAMPDGPKVGSVALSPRGDWRMPSDAECSLWLAELNELRRVRGANG